MKQNKADNSKIYIDTRPRPAKSKNWEYTLGDLSQRFESMTFLIKQKVYSSTMPNMEAYMNRGNAQRYEMWAVLLGFFFFAFMVDSFSNNGDRVISKQTERKFSILCLLAAAVCYSLSQKARTAEIN